MRCVLILTLTACATTATVSGRSPSGLHRTAALAIRDDVPGYQQAFTAQYTVPRLEHGYDRYWYFTESRPEERHQEFVAALNEATRECDVVDVYLLAQNAHYIDWVAEVPSEQRRRIRLVYDTAAGGARDGFEWLAYGVQAFVGHPGANIAPLWYVEFLPRWLQSHSLVDAVEHADAKTHELLSGPQGSTLAKMTEIVDGYPVDLDALWRGTKSRAYTQRHGGPDGAPLGLSVTPTR